MTVADHGDGRGVWASEPDTRKERVPFALAALPQPPDPAPVGSLPAAGIALTADATRLAMAFKRDGVPNVWTIGIGRGRPEGRFVQRTFETEGGLYASWSPDGAWVAYQCQQGTSSHVCVTHAERGGRAQLTSEAGQSFLGGWTADGTEILFAARRGAVWNVQAVSRITGTTRQLTNFTEPRYYVRYPQADERNGRVVFERFETRGRVWSVTIPSPAL